MAIPDKHEKNSARKAVGVILRKVLPTLAIVAFVLIASELIDDLFPQHRKIARGTFLLATFFLWGFLILYLYVKDKKAKARNKEL